MKKKNLMCGCFILFALLVGLTMPALAETFITEPIRQFGYGMLDGVKYGSEGSTFISLSGYIQRTWDIETGEVIHVENLHEIYDSFDYYSTPYKSPDGSKIAFVDSLSIVVYNAETGVQIRRFGDHAEQISSFTFSPDSSKILTGSSDFTARLWDIATGQELLRLHHPINVTSVDFSPDGSQILVGYGVHDVGQELDPETSLGMKLWDAETGEELRTYDLQIQGKVNAMFTPGGDRILVETGVGSQTQYENAYDIQLFDVISGEMVLSLVGHTEKIYATEFSPDGNTLLSGSNDQTARLWDLHTGEELQKFIGHRGGVLYAHFSPDGEEILTGSFDQTIRLWDVNSGDQIQRYDGHVSKFLEDIAFSPDGQLLLTCFSAWDNSARLWKVDSGELLHIFEIDEGVYSAVFSPDGSSLMLGNYKEIQVRNTISGELINTIPLSTTGIPLEITISPDGSKIATISHSKTTVYDILSGEEIVTYDNLRLTAIDYCHFSDNSQNLLIAGKTQMITIDVESGDVLQSFEFDLDYDEYYYIKNVSPNANYVIIHQNQYHDTRDVRFLWKRNNNGWEQVRIMNEISGLGGPYIISITDDGKMFIRNERNVDLIDLNSGLLLQTYIMESPYLGYTIGGAAVSPDGNRLVSVDIYGNIELWDSSQYSNVKSWLVY